MYKAKFLRASVHAMLLPTKPLAAAIVALAIAGQAHAAVSGSRVAAGAVKITTDGAVTTIDQSTDRAVVNWSNFNIAANEKVQINQPSSTSAILNRVDGTLGGTRIDGELNANGQVFIVNAKGIRVGNSGKINANGVVLSNLDVGDADFMKKKKLVDQDTLTLSRASARAAARVVNDGVIEARDGGISLFGGEVINSASGTLQTTASRQSRASTADINLIAADSVTVKQASGVGVGYVGSFKASSSPDAQNLAANDGAINATGASVVRLLGVQNGSSVAVRNTGSITTSNSYEGLYSPGLSNVRFEAGDKGAVYLGGRINAAGDVSSSSAAAPITVDGAINAEGKVILSAYGSSNANISVNAGANIRASDDVLVLAYNGGSAFIDGVLTTDQTFGLSGDTVSVNGSVTSLGPNGNGRTNNISGNTIQLRDGSISAGRYYINGK